MESCSNEEKDGTTIVVGLKKYFHCVHDEDKVASKKDVHQETKNHNQMNDCSELDLVCGTAASKASANSYLTDLNAAESFPSIDAKSTGDCTIYEKRHISKSGNRKRKQKKAKVSPDHSAITSSKTLAINNVSNERQQKSNRMNTNSKTTCVPMNNGIRTPKSPSRSPDRKRSHDQQKYSGDRKSGRSSRGHSHSKGKANTSSDRFTDHPNASVTQPIDHNYDLESPRDVAGFPDNPIREHISSPKRQLDHLAAPESPTKRAQDKDGILSNESVLNAANFKEKHLGWFHLGPLKTSFSISMAILAFGLSLTCKHSTNFVKLDIPIDLGLQYEEVSNMGLFYMEMCRADRSVSIDYANDVVTVSSFIYADDSSIVEEPIETIVHQLTTTDYLSQSEVEGESQPKIKVCERIRLKSNTIVDGVWNVARIFAGMTEWLGAFVVSTLVFAIFWKTMNLIPILIGLLLTYLFQSLAFFFFETGLCKKHGCSQSTGGNFAIGAVVCWFLAWLGVLNIILYERYEKQKAKIIAKKEEHAQAVYEKRKYKRRSFLHNQLSFLLLFSKSGRAEDRNLCDTDVSSGSSDANVERFSCERIEI